MRKLLALLPFLLATPALATTTNLSVPYNLQVFTETELTALDTATTVATSTDAARLVVFTARIGNANNRAAQVTLTIHRDDVQVKTNTYDIPAGNSTLALILEDTSLSIGGHTYEAFVSGTILPLSFTTDTSLEVVGYDLVAGTGATTFLELTDTPSSYSSSDGKYVRAETSSPDALEFGLAAASTNTVSTLVARDGSGNFAAGTITAALTGAVTGNASTATALAANGTNCSAGSAPIGVDASGAVESCTAYQTVLTNSAGLLAALSDETGTGVAVFGTTPTIATPNLTGKGTYNGTSVDDDDCTGEQGKAWYDTTDSTFEVCNANSGAPVAITAPGSTLPAVDTTSIVEGSSDPTKEIRFEVDGLTGSTIRVLTPQDANYTLAGTTVALGGTGLTAGTSGGVLAFTGTTTLSSSAALANDTIVLGGGAGAVPTSSTNFTFDDTNFRIRGQNLTTASDNATRMLQLSGTLPASPSIGVTAFSLASTSAGSAAFEQTNIASSLGGGYTGLNRTVATKSDNAAAGTGTSLNLDTTEDIPIANMTFSGWTLGSTTGINIGGHRYATASTTANIGGLDRANDNIGGTNIGTMGAASRSTEATDPKDIGGYFTNSATRITGSNFSVALLAQSNGTDDVFRGYDDTTLMFRMEDSGEFTSAGTTSLGWTAAAGANTACNTTCTAACVFGVDSAASTILACTDASADSCLCAG